MGLAESQERAQGGHGRKGKAKASQKQHARGDKDWVIGENATPASKGYFDAFTILKR